MRAGEKDSRRQYRLTTPQSYSAASINAYYRM